MKVVSFSLFVAMIGFHFAGDVTVIKGRRGARGARRGRRGSLTELPYDYYTDKKIRERQQHLELLSKRTKRKNNDGSEDTELLLVRKKRKKEENVRILVPKFTTVFKLANINGRKKDNAFLVRSPANVVGVRG